MGFSLETHDAFVGWTRKKFIEENPEWTERAYWDLLCENIDNLAQCEALL